MEGTPLKTKPIFTAGEPEGEETRSERGEKGGGTYGEEDAARMLEAICAAPRRVDRPWAM